MANATACPWIGCPTLQTTAPMRGGLLLRTSANVARSRLPDFQAECFRIIRLGLKDLQGVEPACRIDIQAVRHL